MSIDKQVRVELARLYYRHNPKFTVMEGRRIIGQALSQIHALYMAEWEKILPKCGHIGEQLNFYCSKCSLTAEIKAKLKAMGKEK